METDSVVEIKGLIVHDHVAMVERGEDVLKIWCRRG